ncbi:Rv3235 family protein [Rhodococcus sp. NPDC060086]|uniref:Rv3235 family protein n=1 Tax=Rhodococcus sp. NPDC060086 TaxID=3347055 RepID=UPI003662D189
MSRPQSGRFIRPVPLFEPPVQESCTAHRPHALRRTTPHSGRSGRTRVAADRIRSRIPLDTPLSPDIDPSAHRFADLAVRLVLEVVDGRRPDTQLSTVLTPALATTFSAARHARSEADSAVVLRARLQTRDARTAELFGSYARGHRVFAMAGRVVRAPARGHNRHGWVITTLWLG